MSKATIFGIGLGPGDPDLMSVKADRLVRRIKNVAFFRKAGRKGHARTIVEGLLPMGAIELPMEYPVTTEISVTDPQYNVLLSEFYEECKKKIAFLSEQGHEVAILCEGDPFFYGSFMHLYTRLKDTHPVTVVPAITGMSGAWTASGAPITWGDDVLTVLLGTLSLDELQKRMANSDALVIMKIGRNIEKIRQALKASGLYQKAWLIEYATMPQQTVHKLSECEGRITPYFSIIVVHGQGRRP
ncbi:precorrin-2 C(20)-methyltransferase [Rhodobacterales bacterium FZCC0083]|nr:precorrin-2 C(20)-methyltransferase [Rhodobacterales bacterium FZCC0083]